MDQPSYDRWPRGDRHENASNHARRTVGEVRTLPGGTPRLLPGAGGRERDGHRVSRGWMFPYHRDMDRFISSQPHLPLREAALLGSGILGLAEAPPRKLLQPPVLPQVRYDEIRIRKCQDQYSPKRMRKLQGDFVWQ